MKCLSVPLDLANNNPIEFVNYEINIKTKLQFLRGNGLRFSLFLGLEGLAIYYLSTSLNPKC